MKRCLSYVFLAGACGLLAADSFPIKPGLWEVKATSTGSGATEPTTERVCITPDTWQHMIDKLAKPMPNCTSNQTKTATGISFHGDCNQNKVTTHFKGDVHFDGDRHLLGEMTMNLNVQGHAMDVTYHQDGHFLSSDCGGVKPAEDK